MRVLVTPFGVPAVKHYRLIWPARALAAEGADVTVGTLPSGWWEDIPGELPRVVQVPPLDADVLVMHGAMHHWYFDVLRLYQAQGVAVVVDVDDDVRRIDPGNVVWKGAQPHLNPQWNWRNLARVCEIADLVTVTTPALARQYGGHGRVRVLPNRIPQSYLDIPRSAQDGPVTVGWAGGINVHPWDLQVTRGAVARAVTEGGARFHVVGSGLEVRKRLNLEEEPTATGWVNFGDYPHEVAKLDVGIVPLALTAFNEAKSALKGLQYAALGIPFVASPAQDYARIAADGLGLLAPKPKDWRRILKRLIASPEERAERAGRGREVVAERHTIEGTCGDWLEAWTAALVERRAA